MSELKFASVFTKAFAFAQHSFLFICFLLLLKSRVKTTFDMCGFIDEVLIFLLLNSFTRKNKPRPVKGHGLVDLLLLRYPNN
jgi:hypothetical protein